MNFPSHIKVFIVGGYVRDRLLGREGKDHDFVVVGATPEDMLALGFEKVGADFPVFLHPVSGDEYALARKERKVAAGYNGFDVDFDPSVTLEEDLRRRDLTINAMAREVVGWNEHGHAKLSDDVVDPFGGRKDLDAATLRHVSEAFAEDPVRVLRVARFAARYDFAVHPSTMRLMKQLVDAGELDHLTPERVWTEMHKAMTEPTPDQFFLVMDVVGALQVVLPELDFNDGVQDNLNRALDLPPIDRFAALFAHNLPTQIEAMLDRVKAPKDVQGRAVRVRKLSELLCAGLTPVSVVDTLQALGAFNRHDFREVIEATRAVFRGNDLLLRRLGMITAALPSLEAVNFDSLSDEQKSTLRGPEIGQALRDVRLNIVNEELQRKDHQSA